MTDVALISLEVDVPCERTSLVYLHILSISVLVDAELWRIDLASEDKIGEWCANLATLAVKL